MSVSILLRLAGGCLLIAGSSGYGVWLAGCYNRRLKLLEQLRQMVFLLRSQILYANATLQEAFEAVGRRTGGSPAQLFLEVADRIEKQQGEAFFTIWQETIRDRMMETELKEEDRQQLAALGEHLGFLDKEMQERNLLLYLEQLDLKVDELRTHRQERCRLYTSLGIMAGMFLAILLC